MPLVRRLLRFIRPRSSTRDLRDVAIHGPWTAKRVTVRRTGVRRRLSCTRPWQLECTMARLAMPEYSLITWGPGLVRRLSGHAIGSQGYGDGQLNEPFGVATLRSGRLAVADTLNHRVVVLAPAAGV